MARLAGDDVGHARAGRRVAHRPDRHHRADRRDACVQRRERSASPTSWSTRRRWRPSPRWWPPWPAPRGGGGRAAGSGIFGGTFDPIHTRPPRGGRGGRGRAGPRPDAGGGGQRALAEAGGPTGHPGRGPLRHGRGRRGRLARARALPDGDRPGRAVLHRRHRPPAPAGTEPEAEVSWWSGPTWWPGSTTWKEEAALRDLVTLAVVGRPGRPRWSPRRRVAGRATCRWRRSTCRAPTCGGGWRPGSRWTGWCRRP